LVHWVRDIDEQFPRGILRSKPVNYGDFGPLKPQPTRVQRGGLQLAMATCHGNIEVLELQKPRRHTAPAILCSRTVRIWSKNSASGTVLSTASGKFVGTIAFCDSFNAAACEWQITHASHHANVILDMFERTCPGWCYTSSRHVSLGEGSERAIQEASCACRASYFAGSGEASRSLTTGLLWLVGAGLESMQL